MKKLFPVSLLMFQILLCSAQGPIITPLRSNAALYNVKNKNTGLKRAIKDTLKLPFFEDFTGSDIYPDKNKWIDNYVYINTHFPVSPPGYGVATFDNLDAKGQPYFPLSGLDAGPSDTLTSKPINLKNYLSGTNIINYTIADSIYLSFFYQPQGLGDVLDYTDSLVLRFKDTGENWHTLYKCIGSKIKPFKQILIGIKNVKYLYNGFQFAFINYARYTGNMNQWHLDYIRIKSGRNANDTAVADIAINTVPAGPLKVYNSLPYDHFNSSSQNRDYNLMDSNIVYFRNNNVKSALVNYAFQGKDQLNQILLNIPASASARNILGLSDSSEKFIQMNLSSLVSKEPTITMKFSVIPQSLSTDNLQNSYGGNNANNEYIKTVPFKNYFAYDDGSAEGGYGLDYASIPAGPGYAAIKFQTFIADTLRGISVFFNQSVADVSSKSFELMVWKSITEPPANNTNNDVILKTVSITAPTYLDTINGFVNYVFDTAVALPSGQFYIGWKQTIPYILNVGYDNNYQYFQQAGYRNPNLFYNLYGTWQKVAADITGVPMMRPIVGAKIKTNLPGGIQQVKKHIINIFPNPSNGSNLLKISDQNTITKVCIIDITGKEVYKREHESIFELDISLLSSGLYTIILTDKNNNQYNQKFIKTE